MRQTMMNRSFSLVLLWILIQLQLYHAFILNHNQRKFSIPRCSRGLQPQLSLDSEKLQELQKCLIEEYQTFFSPMYETIYDKDVTFIDPLTTLQGVDRYKANVNLLNGKSWIGQFLFEDASIIMHTYQYIPPLNIQTRWTLQLTAKFLPWKPRLRFTGISKYTLNHKGLITSQEDYWDSVNFLNGYYQSCSFNEAVGDFVKQLVPKPIADLSVPEFPFELLRRGKDYFVRRYPRHVAVTTRYAGGRNEGFERLSGYVNGLNSAQTKLGYFAPSIITVPLDGSYTKTMIWPLKYFLPGETVNLGDFPTPTESETQLIEIPRKTYAIMQFDGPATEDSVRGYTKQLLSILDRDGFRLQGLETLTLAQFNAIYALALRRNEIWIEIPNNPWSK